ncbi:hypothetical protein TD95_000242 [Thielaviopsis punctulata]|uniref:Uncharacterized protein n=1 Tax=Thielaviopsis punctulata TaxID=72032 RepID=A0A0F4ZEM1_9PEZI|nr:hypothetical protein TD95_000242 [Thielaviopsis punctulata]
MTAEITSKMALYAAFSEKQPLPAIETLENFDFEQVEQDKYRPWKPTYNITMAIEKDTASNLISIDATYADYIKARAAIVRDFPTQSHGYTAAGIDSIYEIYTYLTETYLPTRYPAIFTLTQTHLHNAITQLSLPLFSSSAPHDPATLLRLLAETVVEDIFLLKQDAAAADGSSGAHRLVAFVCCAPSGFDPAEKLGLVLRDIHAPVPAYDKIGASMERFFARIEVGKNVKRTNWSVTTHGNFFDVALNHVKGDAKVPEDQDIDCSRAYARIERQTLSRLPQTRAVMFSFKTYLYPLCDIKAEGLGPQLADSIEGLKKGNAPGMWRYKGAVRWGKSVCEYLRA